MRRYYLSWILIFCLVNIATGGSLRVLAWPGYADQDIVQSFENRYGVKVEVTFVDSDETLWDKMHAGYSSEFDVVAANTVEISRYVHDGMLQPLDLAAIPNTQWQLPRFRKLSAIDGLTWQGHIYAIPFTYSSMGLIYDRKQVPVPPHSMKALWNPKYRGKVLAFNSAQHNFSFTALAMGVANPFHLTAEQMHRVALQLVALRRNAMSYYNLPEEATDLFIQHKAALLFANYGTQQLTALRQAGADVGYIIPDEGAIAWLDCWAMTRAARDRVLAQSWINYMFDPAVAKLFTKRQGLANTLTQPAEVSDNTRILWLQPVENIQQREALWSKIVSGDRPGSF